MESAEVVNLFAIMCKLTSSFTTGNFSYPGPVCQRGFQS